MKIKLIKLSAFIFALGLYLSACEKDKHQPKLPPPVVNSPELITGLALQFTDSANTTNVSTFEFRDADGPGGAPPSRFDTIKLDMNSTYRVKIFVFDETKNPVDTVSKEIEIEKDDHQFFFTQTGVQIHVTYNDMDSKGLPLGLLTTWRTGLAANGTSRVVLKHQAGIKNGSEASGETDIEITFPCNIQ